MKLEKSQMDFFLKMFLNFALLILIPAHVFSFSSYHSSLLKNGKPILRGGGPEMDEGASELDQGLDKKVEKIVESENTNESNELIWLLDLKHSIRRLVNQFGFEAAKPLIERLVEDTEAARMVLLDVIVSRSGDSHIEYKYSDYYHNN